MPQTKRLFYALEVGESQRDIAGRAQDRLRASYQSGRLRFTKPADFHVTLLFLGERPDTDLTSLIETGEEIAANFDCFSLKLTDIGAFPDLKSPRVLWLGIGEDDLKTASALSQELRHRTAPGSADAFSFKPHLTLARLAAPISPELAESAQAMLVEGDPASGTPDRVISVSRFVLMETLPVAGHTNSGESRYNIVHSFLLRKPRANHTPAANPLMEKVGN